MPSLGWQELIIVLIIVVIIFGAGKLPEIGGAMGKSIKEFKKEASSEPNPDSLTEGKSGTVIKTDAPKTVETREMRADEI
jgi:sec-independent protein translocase protein TatA